MRPVKISSPKMSSPTIAGAKISSSNKINNPKTPGAMEAAWWPPHLGDDAEERQDVRVHRTAAAAAAGAGLATRACEGGTKPAAFSGGRSLLSLLCRFYLRKVSPVCLIQNLKDCR
jgi:hypothetical protein